MDDLPQMSAHFLYEADASSLGMGTVRFAVNGCLTDCSRRPFAVDSSPQSVKGSGLQTGKAQRRTEKISLPAISLAYFTDLSLILLFFLPAHSTLNRHLSTQKQLETNSPYHPLLHAMFLTSKLRTMVPLAAYCLSASRGE